MKRFLLLLCLFSLCSSLFFRDAQAQAYIYATGNPTFGVNIPIENGFINVANGNLHMEFSLATQKQRGALKLNERLVYDSHIWMIGHYSNYYWWPSNVPNTPYDQGGWRFVTGAETGTVSYNLSSGSTQGTCQSMGGGPSGTQNNYIYTLSWSDPIGTNHAFNAYLFDDENTCGYPTQRSLSGGYATDGSGYQIVADQNNNPIVLDNNGNEVYPEVIDRYGNYWSSDASGNLIDDVGRKPVIVTKNGNVTYYDVLSPNGPINNNGTRVRYTVTTAPIQVQTHFFEPSVTEWSGTLDPIQSIQLPDGSSYTFTYDTKITGVDQSPHYGELTSVTLPTGGVIHYGWTVYEDSYGNQNRWLTSRTAGSDPSTTFTPSVISYCSANGTGCQEQVVLHKPSGDETVYKLTLNNGAWNTNTISYSGSAASGTALINVATDYDFSHPCNTQICTGAQYIKASKSTTTLLDKGLQSHTEYVFSQPWVGKPDAIKNWDYYTGSLPSEPTLETDLTYAGYNLTESKVLEGTHQIALTNYNYTSNATTTTGVVGHGAQNAGGPYLSSVDRWVNDSSSITTSYTYDDTGTVLSSTDPNGTTTYGHDATDTLVTNTMLPMPSSGITLSFSTTYDLGSGLPWTTTDPNGAVSRVVSYATNQRPAQSSAPDGEATYYYYSPNQTGVVEYMGPSGPQDTETLFDDFGRKSRVAVGTGQQNSYYQTDYCYNSMGQLQFQSVRYQGNGWGTPKQCSGAGTSYSYDALGRMTASTNADGTTQYLYIGRAIQVTDVNGVKRITQSDALGRVNAICEISSNSSMPGSGSPQDCGLDISGTGFLTTYAYDLPNHTTTITQGAQHRDFQTDPVGRTIYTFEPERGITRYSYVYNATGLLVTRQRPKANQTNSSVFTNTTTQYDSLGRVVRIDYDDGTSTKAYAYDLPSNWGVGLGSSKGRLAYAWTSPFWTGTQFTYDIMGRVTQSIQCLPWRCGNPSYNMTRLYTYDLGGNLTQESYFLGASSGTRIDTNYTISPTREVTAISNTLTGAANDLGAILSNVVSGPMGPNTYQFGNGLDGVITYDAMGRPNGSWVCSGSIQFECGGGTQLYGNLSAQGGDRVYSIADTILNSPVYFGYDEFNRITSANYTFSSDSFTYGYDRYGNRWSQSVTQGNGPAPQLTFNVSNNQVVGYSYDAVGNLMSDGIHSYTYDAEGNVLQVDGGSTAAYVYDAFNHRVQTVANGLDRLYVYNVDGRRASVWDNTSSTPLLVSATTYWNGQPISFYNGSTYFQHQDVHGTERLRTAADGSVAGFYQSFAFGDAFSSSGQDYDPYHFARLDHDSESDTDHAQFRQYSPTQGRWMSPDPYNGSMDLGNPQSFNRYSYVGNMPLSYTDPSGLLYGSGSGGGCDTACVITSTGELAAGGFFVYGIYEGLKHLIGFGGPAFHGSLSPRPSTGDPNWDGNFGESLGLPVNGPALGGGGIGGLFGLPSGCEFGPCGGGFQAGAGAGAIACQLAEPCGAIADTAAIIAVGGMLIYDGVNIYRGRTNVADTGITSEAQQLVGSGRFPSICAALAFLQSTTRDSARLQKIKATQKAFGCRRNSTQR